MAIDYEPNLPGRQTRPRLTPRGRTILIGAITTLCGLLLLSAPALLGPSIGRFFVVAGFLAICGGISIMVHALLEKWKR